MELRLFREQNDQAWNLYENSFPCSEKRPKDIYNNTLKCENYMPYHIMENDKFIGILYCWEFDDFYYVEHFATLAQVRGNGYGAMALNEFFRLHKDKKIILEIDPPVTEIAIRREKFYQRIGLLTNEYKFIHPSYCDPKTPHELVIMSYPRLITEQELEDFKTKTFVNV